MARMFLGGMIGILAAGVALAQPQYEAASIKPNSTGGGGSSSNGSKGQIVFTNVPLKRLVERAYNLKPFQVAGPGWMDDVRFDIAAKFPPDTRPEDRNLMLRALLEERFKLAVHRESKDLPGYALVVAKSGFKLKPVDPGGSSTNSNGGRIRTLKATKTSMEFLADLLARDLSLMVVDKTGIAGVYDFELRYTTDDQNPPPDSEAVPSLIAAVQETLGLRLQSQKVPVEIIVVDHVERTPIEN